MLGPSNSIYSVVAIQLTKIQLIRIIYLQHCTTCSKKKGKCHYHPLYIHLHILYDIYHIRMCTCKPSYCTQQQAISESLVQPAVEEVYELRSIIVPELFNRLLWRSCGIHPLPPFTKYCFASSLSLSLCLSLSLSLFLFLPLYLYLSISLSLSLYPSISLSLSLSLFLSLSLCLSISLFFISLSPSLYLFLSISLSLFLPLYLSLSLSLSLCFCLSISLYFSSL